MKNLKKKFLTTLLLTSFIIFGSGSLLSAQEFTRTCEGGFLKLDATGYNPGSSSSWCLPSGCMPLSSTSPDWMLATEPGRYVYRIKGFANILTYVTQEEIDACAVPVCDPFDYTEGISGDKVTICKNQPNGKKHLITVNLNALDAHRANGATSVCDCE